MEFAVCECGTRIIIVHDIEKMRQAIDSHATIHAKLITNSEKAEVERRRIEMQLARKVIISIIGLDASVSIVPDDNIVSVGGDCTF